MAMWLRVCSQGSGDVSRRGDDILVDSGRPLDALWHEDAPWFWKLNA